MGAKTMISVEEFDRLEEEEFRYELDQGELITMTRPRTRHTRVERNLTFALHSYFLAKPVGEMLGADILFVLGPTTKRAPDVSVVLRPIPDPDEEIQGAPEIAVEILSPSNRQVDISRKLEQFFAAGCKLVWIVDPASQTVGVQESAGGPIRTLHSSDSLETALLPGFSLPVSKLF